MPKKAPQYFDKKIDVFEEDEEARVKRIASEFLKGFKTLGKYRNAVSFFGSSRLAAQDK